MKKLILPLVLIAFLATGCNSSQSINPPSQSTNTTPAPVTINQPAQTQPPAVSNTTPSPQKKLSSPSSNIDESRACSQQAAIVAKDLKDTGASLGYPIAPGSFNYQSHYNATKGKCFYVGTSVGAYNGNSVLDESLQDAYENTTIATYFDELSSTSPATKVSEYCTINGVAGCTNLQFRAFLNTEMESTMY